MCGIVCGISLKDVVPIMLNGLKLLEYRGYDSAGMAALDYETQILTRARAQGKVSQLEKVIKAIHLKGNLGVAQTRWATHGKPSEQNAHPHASDHVMVVHNGIVENHGTLRKMLEEKGYIFETETDTETVPHLIHYCLSQQKTPNFLAAVMEARSHLEGAFALGIISSQFPDELIGVINWSRHF
jgi:glucosamine--fructose-6-phosphate aminotransferase (isomerizing)